MCRTRLSCPVDSGGHIVLSVRVLPRGERVPNIDDGMSPDLFLSMVLMTRLGRRKSHSLIDNRCQRATRWVGADL